MPLLADDDTDDVLRHDAGAMDVICKHCAARFFRSENLHCCTHGAVSLPVWRTPPEPLLFFYVTMNSV
jgi:hypothetical protein